MLSGLERTHPALKFVALSGVGWVLDTTVYLLLVQAGVVVLLASCIGGLCGASFAFLTSSRFVFDFRGGGLRLRFLLYLAYTLTNIFVSAAATQALANVLIGHAGASLVVAAFLAKCLVTPLVLAANFLVARRILRVA